MGEQKKIAAHAVNIGGREVVMRELSLKEVLDAGKRCRSLVGMSNEAARVALLHVDGKAVKYTDLMGDRLKALFPRTRHRIALHTAWGLIHNPTEEQADAFDRAIKVEVSDGAERWVCTLTDGRTCTLVEQDEATLEDIQGLERAEKGGPGAELEVNLVGLCKSITSLGDKPLDKSLNPRRLSDLGVTYRDALLLVRAFNRLHTGEDGSLGKLELVPVAL